MGAPVSKLLCLAVLAFAPACLGDDPETSIGNQLGSSKIHSPIDNTGFDHPEVLPPKPRVREDATTASLNHGDYIEEISDGGGYTIDPAHIDSIADVVPVQATARLSAADIDPTHLLTAAAIQPVVLLHHFDEYGVEHITRLDEKALRGE